MPPPQKKQRANRRTSGIALSQLNNSSVVGGRPPSPIGQQSKGGLENAPFQLAAKQLEIDENVNRAPLTRHFQAMNEGLENRSAFAKALNE